MDRYQILLGRKSKPAPVKKPVPVPRQQKPYTKIFAYEYFVDKEAVAILPDAAFEHAADIIKTEICRSILPYITISQTNDFYYNQICLRGELEIIDKHTESGSILTWKNQ